MDGLVLIIVLIIICVGSYLFLSIFIQDEKRNFEVLKRQAKKRNGRASKALLMSPILDFSVQGIKITVSSAFQEGEGDLRIMKCSLKQCRTYTCIIIPSSYPSFRSMSKLPPKIDIKEPLPNQMIMYSNDKEMTEQFLNTDVRELFKQLHGLRTFEIKNGFFALKISGAMSDDQTADQFIEAGLTLMKRCTELHTPQQN